MYIIASLIIYTFIFIVMIFVGILNTRIVSMFTDFFNFSAQRVHDDPDVQDKIWDLMMTEEDISSSRYLLKNSLL